MLPILFAAFKVAAVVAAAAVGAAVVIKIARLTWETLKKGLRKHNASAVGAKIGETLKEGNFNTVKVGLFDEDFNECGEVEIKAESIDDPIKKGDVIILRDIRQELADEISSTQSILNNVNQKIKKKKNEIKNLEDEISSRNAYISQLKDQLDHTFFLFFVKKRKLREEISALSLTLSKMENEKVVAEKALEKLKKESLEIEESLEDLENTLQQKQALYDKFPMKLQA